MKTRTDLLNFLADTYKLERYLEIGVQNRNQNYDSIKCRLKVSVDPDPSADVGFHCTSDQFFEDIHPWWVKDGNPGMSHFDLIFIDGLHTKEQVKKDFENALKVLSPNGFIVLHDCNPLKEEHTIVPRPKPGHWNGDVYKFAMVLGEYFRKFIVVDIDNGCGVWNNNGDDVIKDTYYQGNDWQSFNQNRKQLLNLISWDEFINSHSHVQ